MVTFYTKGIKCSLQQVSQPSGTTQEIIPQDELDVHKLSPALCPVKDMTFDTNIVSCTGRGQASMLLIPLLD